MRKKRYIHIMTVSGRGRFPFDMLRYDRCFPYGSADVLMLMAEPGEDWTGKVARYSDSAKPDFTPDRWASFHVGADVRTIETKEL